MHAARSYAITKKDRRPKAPVQRFAEPLAIPSTSPADFPISALADILVRPFGAASTYSRCALGAKVNLQIFQARTREP
jgi:hypothetical protein